MCSGSIASGTSQSISSRTGIIGAPFDAAFVDGLWYLEAQQTMRVPQAVIQWTPETQPFCSRDESLPKSWFRPETSQKIDDIDQIA